VGSGSSGPAPSSKVLVGIAMVRDSFEQSRRAGSV
jgi:hypothetical protein